MKLSEMLDVNLLHEMIEQKYVRVQRHSVYPLSIYNYSDACTYDRVWNDVTLNTRGLIVSDAGDVIARPFGKFFNLFEPDGPAFADNDRVLVTDKLDGSLGIGYFWDKQWHIATRGSFHSVQATTACQMLDATMLLNPVWWSALSLAMTPVFEIIYPENRIVVDYKGERSLRMLGWVKHYNGALIPPEQHDFPTIVEDFGTMDFCEVADLPDRDNKEGVVIRRVGDGAMAKIKQDDYVRLHRIMAGWTKRTVWQYTALAMLNEMGYTNDKRTAQALKIEHSELSDRVNNAHVEFDKAMQTCPEEFVEWVTRTRKTFVRDFIEMRNETINTVEQCQDGGMSRSEIAVTFASSPIRSLMFLHLDNKNFDLAIWKMLYPKTDERPFTQTEE